MDWYFKETFFKNGKSRNKDRIHKTASLHSTSFWSYCSKHVLRAYKFNPAIHPSPGESCYITRKDWHSFQAFYLGLLLPISCPTLHMEDFILPVLHPSGGSLPSTFKKRSCPQYKDSHPCHPMSLPQTQPPYSRIWVMPSYKAPCHYCWGYHVCQHFQHQATKSSWQWSPHRVQGSEPRGRGNYWRSTKDHGKQVQRSRGVADPFQFQVRHLRG